MLIIYKRSAMSENVHSDMRAQWLKSACTCMQSDQNLCCPHEETLHPWLSKMHPVKIPIRLHKCTGSSESSLGAYIWHCRSNGAISEYNISLIRVHLTLSTFGKNFRSRHFEKNFFFFFFQKIARRSVKTYFLEKVRKILSICRLLNTPKELSRLSIMLWEKDF